MYLCKQDLDGIRVLSGLLRGGYEVTGHDAIRALACRSLLGLTHEPRIRQILQESQVCQYAGLVCRMIGLFYRITRSLLTLAVLVWVSLAE